MKNVEKSRLNCDIIWKIWKKGKMKCEYGRKKGRLVIRYGNYGRKAS